MSEILLEVCHLSKHFGGDGLLRSRPPVKAVDGVSLTIPKAGIVGLVGESGCGKSTLGQLMVGLLVPTAGHIYLYGQDVTHQNQHQRIRFNRQVQFVFQDSFGSLNPRRTVAQTLGAPLQSLLGLTKTEQRKRIQELLDLVGLHPDLSERYPHEFSGGQRQRIAIARALAVEPALIILDEPVSALDVSVQAQVLQLLRNLQNRLGVAYLFISHDLSVVETLCKQVAVMYLGRIVEIADREALFNDPKHPYTRVLLSSVPIPGQRRRKSLPLKGDVHSGRPLQGCAFEPRCYRAEPPCQKNDPSLANGPVERPCACWFADDSAPR